jgi:hypothetical protein
MTMTSNSMPRSLAGRPASPANKLGATRDPSARHAVPIPASRQPSMSGGAFGYPEGWPAGPWIVPLFWLATVCGAWLLH